MLKTKLIIFFVTILIVFIAVIVCIPLIKNFFKDSENTEVITDETVTSNLSIQQTTKEPTPEPTNTPLPDNISEIDPSEINFEYVNGSLNVFLNNSISISSAYLNGIDYQVEHSYKDEYHYLFRIDKFEKNVNFSIIFRLNDGNYLQASNIYYNDEKDLSSASFNKETKYLITRNDVSNSDSNIFLKTPNLIHLNLKDCTNLTLDLFSITQLENLEYLALSEYYNNSSCDITGNTSDFNKLIKLKYLFFERLNGIEININELFELKYLKELHIASCRYIAGEISALKNLENLEVLNIPYSQDQLAITGDISEIAALNHLRMINLDGNGGIEGNLSSVSNLRELIDINLRNTSISGDIKSLSNISSIKRINLGWVYRHNNSNYRDNNVNITGDIECIKDLSNLETFSITDIDVYGDIAAFSSLENLNYLSLRKANIHGDIGLLQEMFARNNYSQHCIDVDYTNITGRLTSPEGEPLKIVKLYDGNRPITKEELECVTHLELCNVSNLKFLEDLVQLREISSNNVDSVHGNLSSLSNLINLEVIDINGGSLLASYDPNKTHLYPQITGDIASLSNLTKLTKIRLDMSKVSGDLADISELSNLTVLRLIETKISGDIQSVLGMANLEELVLSGTKVTGDVSTLSALKNLEVIGLYKTTVYGDILFLGNLTNLRKLLVEETNATGKTRLKNGDLIELD